MGKFITQIALLTSLGWGAASLVKASKIINTVKTQWQNFSKVISMVTSNAGSLSTALKSVGENGSALSGLSNILSPVLTIVSTLIVLFGTLISSIVQAAEEAKQRALEIAKANTEYADSLENLVDEYDSIINSTDDYATKEKNLLEFKEKLNKEYGIELDKLKDVNLERKTGIKLLGEEAKAKRTQAWVSAQPSYEEAYQQYTLQNASDQHYYFSEGKYQTTSDVLTPLEQFGIGINAVPLAESLYIDVSQFENMDELINNLTLALQRLREDPYFKNNLTQYQYDYLEGILTSWLDYYRQQLANISENLTTGQEALVGDITKSLYEDTLTLGLDTYLIDSVESYEKAIEAVKEYTEDSKVQEAVIAALQSRYPQYSYAVSAGADATNYFTSQMKAAQAAMEELNNQIDSLQSATDLLTKAQEEYNSTGGLSIDTIQSLLQLDAQYLDALIDENGQINLTTAAMSNLNGQQVSLLESTGAQAVAAYAAAEAQRLFGENLDGTGSNADKADDKIKTLGSEVQNAALQFLSGAMTVAQFSNAVAKIGEEQIVGDLDPGKVEEFSRNVQNYASNVMSTLRSFSGSFSSFTRSTSNALQDQADAYRTAFDFIKSKAQDEIDALQQRKQAIEDSYNAQIEAIRNANEELEEQLQLENALDDLARARQQKVMVYKDGRFQYIEDIDAVSEAAGNLEDVQREISINNQIRQLEELRDREVASLEARIEYWEKYIDEVNDAVNSYEEEQDRLIAEQVLGIELEGENWEKRLGNLSDYVRRYNQILSQMRSSSGSSGVGSVSSGSSSKKSSKKPKTVLKSEYVDASGTIQRIWGLEYASGTTNAQGGLSLVGENGPELRVLNSGDGIIPADITKNLWDWGKFNPKQFNSMTDSNKASVIIENLNLPEVKDGPGFANYLKNNFWRKVVQLQLQ